MSLIEQAAKRLEELRRAGVDVPGEALGASPPDASILERAMAIETAPAAAAVARGNGEAGPATPAPRTAPVVGATQSQAVTLDLTHLAAAGIITPEAPRSQIADEFRIVKRPLLANASGKSASRVANGNLIMVTSALPGEGRARASPRSTWR